MSAPGPGEILDVDASVLEPREIWTEFTDGIDRARVHGALRLEEAGTRAEMVLGGTRVAAALPFASGALRADSPAEWAQALDARGLRGAVLTPLCLFSGLPWVEDRRAASALVRGYNAWAADRARGLPDRLFPVGLLAPGDGVDAAAELRRIADSGLRAVWVCPARPLDRAIAPRDFWGAVRDAGLAAYVHPALWSPPDVRSHASIISDLLGRCGRGSAGALRLAAPMDCAALLMGLLAEGVLESLPGLRLIFAGAGVAWLPLALEKTESALWLCHQDRPVCLETEQVFAAGVHAVAFDARDGTAIRMHEHLARTAAWGSGSTGGRRDPEAVLETLRAAALPDDRVNAFLAGNAARALGLT